MGQIGFDAMAFKPHSGSPPTGLTFIQSSGTSNPDYWIQRFVQNEDAAILASIPKLPSNFTTTNLALEVNFTKNNANVEVVTFRVDIARIDPIAGWRIDNKAADVGSQDDATTGSVAYALEVTSIGLTSNNDSVGAGDQMIFILWVLGGSGTNHTLTTPLFVTGATLVWDD